MSADASVEFFSEESLTPPVRGFLHRPARGGNNGLVLSHGAGSNCRTPLLIALSEAFAARGVTVLRCDLPYRQRRPSGPPRPADAALDREGLRNAARAIRRDAGQIILGGHSYGGRQSSMLCASDAAVAQGLLLLSYPLHPPDKPEQLRTQHFPELRTPALFVHGTRDPFGSVGELEVALRLIPAKTRLMVLGGVGHDLGFKGRNQPIDVAQEIAGAALEFFGERVG